MNIYFSGIGGVGLGPLAQMSLDAGHTVTGSDMSAGLTTDELTGLGVTVHIGEQDGEFLREAHAQAPFDLLVYTAALPADHPELTVAHELDIPTTKRDGLLAHIISESGQKLVAVAGTHGKTTTTGILVWVFNELDIPVSYSVGSQLGFGQSGKFNPDAEYFVYECDEFDRNFLKFHPHLSVITSIDYDHPDTYPTEAEYTSAFRQFVHQSDLSILWQADADYIQTRDPAAWCLQSDEVLQINLAGAHNRRNATLVIKAFERLSVGENKELRHIIDQFPGTLRRFERLTDNLYSDYGHHPVEITATLQMARELNDHVILVYQPHQNVRQHEIRDHYTDDIFKDADEVFWLPTYLSREDPDLEILSPVQLTTELSSTIHHFADLDDTLWSEITRHLDAGHLVLCMGAGSIDGWLRSKLN